MKMSEPRWLSLYAWVVLFASPIETVLVVSGDVQKRLAMAVFSLASIALGLAAAAFVLGGHFTFAKAAQSIIGARYFRQLESMAALVFWFGIVGSAALILFYPLLVQHDIPFSIAPVGIGFTLGAKWIFKRYNPAATHST